MGRNRIAAAIAACHFLVSVPHAALAEFRIIHEAKSDRLVIFVHGLWGDINTSFSAGGSSSSWPELMKSDTEEVRGQPSLSSYSSAYLGFPASRGDRLSIPQIATSLLNELSDNGVFDSNKTLYFITHSLGGLVVKEMLLDATISKRFPITDRTKAIFLISSPSSGAEAADFVSKLPTFIPGRLVADLKTITDNSYLQRLQVNWHNFLRATPALQRIGVYCAYETKSIANIVVVPQQYADSFCDETPEAMNEDHISIAKPTNKSARVYTWVRGRLADHAIRKPSIVPQPTHLHLGRTSASVGQSVRRLDGGARPIVDLSELPDALPDRTLGAGEAPRDARQNVPKPLVKIEE